MSENFQMQFNNVQRGKELLSTDREPLLQLAFIVKCIADFTLVLGVLFVIILIFSRTRFGDPDAIFAGIWLIIPIVILYYIFHSISVSLKASAELHDKIDMLQKMLHEKTSMR